MLPYWIMGSKQNIKRWLIIFAKEPKIDRVKTRLSPVLSPARRLALYKAFLKDTFNLAKRVSCEQKVVAYSSESEPVYLYKLAKAFQFSRQRGGNLGERIHNAFVFAQAKGATSAVIIGSDSPTLPVSLIDEAFLKLGRNDLVLGPALDGGYYLIGLKEPWAEIFREISWSSNYVFSETLKRAKQYKKKVVILSQWYDVDDELSLSYLIRDLKRIKAKKIASFSRKALAV